MKKSKSLMILLGVLVVSIGALTAVNLSNTTSSATPSQTTAPTSTAQDLISFNKNDLKEILLKDNTGTLTFLPTKDHWSIKDAPSIDLDFNAIEDTCYNLLHISSFRTIKSPNLSEFGLDNSQRMIQYTLQDGQTTSLTLGLTTPDGSKYYALKNNNPEEVYLISSSDGIEVVTDLERYRIRALDTFNPSSFAGLKASGRAIEPIHVTTSLESSSQKYAITSPEGTVLDVDIRALEKLLTSLPTFAVDTFVADGVSDLTPYGLDNPVLHLSLEGIDPNDPSQMVTLEYLWGNDVNDASIYFMKAGTNSIYTMKNDAIHSVIQQLTNFNLSNKLVCITLIDLVHSIEIAFEDTTYTLSIRRENDNTTYFLNEKIITEDDFKALYQHIIGTKADSDLTQKDPSLKNPAAVTFTFNFTDGSSKQHLFYDYDNQFYTYKIDDTLLVGCNIKQFEFLTEALSTAVNTPH